MNTRKVFSDTQKQKIILISAGIIGLFLGICFVLSKDFSWLNVLKGCFISLITPISIIMAWVGSIKHVKDDR